MKPVVLVVGMLALVVTTSVLTAWLMRAPPAAPTPEDITASVRKALQATDTAMSEQFVANLDRGHQMAVVTTLRSSIYESQKVMKREAFIDQDKNTVGEYALLSELAGGPVVGMADDIRLSLIQRLFLDPEPETNGYRYVLYLPDGSGGVISTGPRTALSAAAPLQEAHYVVYAWPTDLTRTTLRMFALLPDGVVRSAPFTGTAPAWKDLMTGGSWDGAPLWEPHVTPKE